jgi:hypothetical protein
MTAREKKHRQSSPGRFTSWAVFWVIVWAAACAVFWTTDRSWAAVAVTVAIIFWFLKPRT